MKDSKYFMEWKEFLSIVQQAGFVALAPSVVKYELTDERGFKTHNLIAVNKQLKLLLHATSVQADKILQLDGGRIYGVIEPDATEFKSLQVRNKLTCVQLNNSNSVFFSLDVRLPILARLADFEASKVKLTAWPAGHPEPHLLDNVTRDTLQQAKTENHALWHKVKSRLSFVA